MRILKRHRDKGRFDRGERLLRVKNRTSLLKWREIP